MERKKISTKPNPTHGQLGPECTASDLISYQTFSPQHIRVKELGVSVRERLEKMSETFDKVVAFLQTTG